MPRNQLLHTSKEPSVLHAFSTLKQSIIDVFEYRIYFVKQVKLHLFSQYRKSWLGILWLFIAPFFGMVTWLALKYTGLFNPGDTGVPYAVYILLTTTIWNLFMSQYDSLHNIISTSGSMLLRAVFPIEVIIATRISISFFNFYLTFIIVYIIILFLGAEFTPFVLLIPFILLPLTITGIAIGLFISVFEILLVDVFKTFNFLFKNLIYTTPILYSEKVSNEILRTIVQNNPLTYLITVPRDILLNQKVNDWEPFIYTSIGAVILFILSFHFFKVSLRKSLEKII